MSPKQRKRLLKGLTAINRWSLPVQQRTQFQLLHAPDILRTCQGPLGVVP